MFRQRELLRRLPRVFSSTCRNGNEQSTKSCNSFNPFKFQQSNDLQSTFQQDFMRQNSRLYHIGQRGERDEFSGMRGTTVLSVRRGGKVVVVSDGQVTMGSAIVKHNVKKVRRLGENGQVLVGFAGATADAFTLFERLDMRLEEHDGQLMRAAVELAKAWRMDKYLRRLDAVMVVADASTSLTITGNGDIVEPYDGIIGIGSGGPYALAAARALIDIPGLDAEDIAIKAMKIAANTCIYTNHNFSMEIIAY